MVTRKAGNQVNMIRQFILDTPPFQGCG